MNIKLNNIGIIKNSDIRLDGLTVITGQNNSGKTTVGKVIYSLVDAVSNLPAKAKNDKRIYILDTLNDIQDDLHRIGFYRRPSSQDEQPIFPKDSAIGYLLHDFTAYPSSVLRSSKYEDIESFTHILREELAELDVDLIINNPTFHKYRRRTITSKEDFAAIKEKISNQVNKSVLAIDEMFENMENDSELIDYARESISRTLRVEFSKQIQPVKVDAVKSRIEVTDDNSVLFAFDVADNKIVNDGNPVFYDTPYKKVFFIDNPFVLDPSPYRLTFSSHDLGDNAILNTRKILSHEEKLHDVLKSNGKTTVFEETVINRGLTQIKQKINAVMSGDFEFSSDGDFYVKDGKKLSLTNLATGSKMFSVLKILIDKGEIDDGTLLIFDEPEAHLHPSWQNKFAEIIVLLVKYLNAGVLLTSHSPNFVLAIDAYMRKYDVIDKTNFYQTNHLDDYFVEYKNANDDIGRIYDDFVRYLSEVKVLRDMYFTGMGG